MSLIDDIKRDHIPGQWIVHPNRKEVVTYEGGELVCHDEYGLMEDRELRRISRVPDMEAALIAADELAREIDKYKYSEIPLDLFVLRELCRKATGDT